MDGLECKEILFSSTQNNKDFRIDSQFYTITIKRNDSLHYIPIGEYLISTQYGVSKDMNTEGVGYPIFRMNEIHHSLCDLTTEKFVDLTNKEFFDVMLNDRDVLFNRTNSYDLVGRTGVYYSCGIPQTFASYLVRLVPDNISLYSEYLAAFLNTCYGIQELRRRARQSVNQTNINPEEVKAIDIPLLRKEIQEEIKKCYLYAHDLRLTSSKKYYDAEQLFEDAFCIEPLEEVDESTFVESLSHSFLKTGRFDAEYYQPKYAKYTDSLYTEDTVDTLCKLHDKTFLPKKNVVYRYIELSNVGLAGEISGVNTIIGAELPSRARRKVKSGQIVISSVEGSLQSCALITTDLDECLCSTGFYVLDSKDINPETLLVLFKSKVIQSLMKQRCSGTILSGITKDELLSMPLPKVDKALQKAIAAKVQESFALRRQSKQLLEYAKQAVEIAIEQGENAALAWLKDKISASEV